LPSYIENTLDLLRHLEELEFEDLPKEAIPVTIDVVGFYSNIPQGQAQKFMKDALKQRKNWKLSWNFLIHYIQQSNSHMIMTSQQSQLTFWTQRLPLKMVKYQQIYFNRKLTQINIFCQHQLTHHTALKILCIL